MEALDLALNQAEEAIRVILGQQEDDHDSLHEEYFEGEVDIERATVEEIIAETPSVLLPEGENQVTNPCDEQVAKDVVVLLIP